MCINIFNLTHAFTAVVNAPVHAVTNEFSDFIAVVFKMVFDQLRAKDN